MYTINNFQYTQESDQLMEALKDAYNKKQRPICNCTSDGVPMYIAKIGDGSFIIKRMPNTGNKHHPSCDSYEVPYELSGRGHIEDNAITTDTKTNITSLKLDFSLTKIEGKAPPGPSGESDNTDVEAGTSKMTMKSLLQYLYEEAELNKWSKRMKGKRNWYVIYKYLQLASEGKKAKRNSLSEIVYIPEPFSMDKKNATAARRKQFLSKFKKINKTQSMPIIIGELKSLEEARFGYKLVIKHMSDCPVYLNDDVYGKIMNKFILEMSFFQENDDIHILVICTAVTTPSGNLQLNNISLMMVDENWLPFESISDLDLVSNLVEKERNFTKSLRYNIPKRAPLASCILRDVGDEPCAIYVLPADSDDEVEERYSKVIDESEVNSILWDQRNGEELVLPN